MEMTIIIAVLTGVAGFFIKRVPKKDKEAAKNGAGTIKELMGTVYGLMDGRITAEEAEETLTTSYEIYKWMKDRFGDNED